MAFEFNNPLLYELREGSALDPFVPLSTTSVITSNKIVLTELPNEFEGITISGYAESKSPSGLIATTFYCNYINGILSFASSENGKTVTANFKGRGIVQIPAERIYSTDGNGVVETLQNMINSGLVAIESLGGLTTAISTAQALETELDSDISTGNILKSDLDDSIDSATIINGTLDGTIETANISIGELNETNASVQANEDTRQSNENIRESQESNRQNTYSTSYVKFKGVVTGKTSLPASGNILGDTYQVIDDATTSNNAMWRYNGTIFEKSYVLDLTFAGGYGGNNSQVFTATAGQTVFTLTEFPYLIGVNQLMVYVTGIKQIIGVNYTETSTNSFTLTSGVVAGTKVEAFRSVPGGAGSLTTQEVENARVSSLGIGYANLKARLDDHDSNKVGVLANLNTSVKTDIVSAINEQLAETTSELATKARQVDLALESARITNLATLAEGSTTGDAEVIDGRVGADGITYENIGGAVRGQIGKINDLVGDSLSGAITESNTTLTIGTLSTADGSITASIIRANEVLDSKLVANLFCKSGYYFLVYGTNVKGTALTAITSWVTSFTNTNTYQYLYIIVKYTSDADISGHDLTSILSVVSHGEVVLSKVENTTRYGGDITSVYANLIPGNLDSTGNKFIILTRAFIVLPTYNISGFVASSGCLIYVLTNNKGYGYPFNAVGDWVTEYTIDDDSLYVAVIVKNNDGSNVTNLTSSLTVNYLSEKRKLATYEEMQKISQGELYLAGKILLWTGTSIPEQGHPILVGAALGATVINNAVGSSMMRIGSSVYDSSDLGDDLGITGMWMANVLRSLSMTQDERRRLFDCWTTADRKSYLINEGYTSEQVASVIGYSNMFADAYVGSDPVTPVAGIPSSKPVDVWAGDGEIYKSMRQLSYSYCWDDSLDIEGDLSISGKITGTILGRIESYIGTSDAIVFEHFRNDATGDALASTFTSVPATPNDRHYCVGAFIYLVQQIYLRNPRIKILMIGHYDNDDTRYNLGSVWEAEKTAADYFGFPLCPLWEESGIRARTQVTTTGYWDASHVWHDTEYNGTNHVGSNLESLNENVRQIDGVWVHDLSLRQIWMYDDIHPMSDVCKQHLAGLISAWLKTQTIS